MTRHFWVLIHRYAGLYMAFFLIVAGLTGSILAFYHEIDHWLNPELHKVAIQQRAMLDPFELRERAKALVPKAHINEVRFLREPGEVYSVMLMPATDPATNKPYDLAYNTLRLNPYSGELIEFSKEGSYWPLTRKNILSFIYALHYQLALGDFGMWLFGIAALIWTLDCFVGFYLTFPVNRKRAQLPENSPPNKKTFWSRWAIAWKIKWSSSTYRVNFDLHRAGGLWTWIMLFIFAWSSVAFNLGKQVYQPVMQTLFAMPDFETFPIGTLPQPRPIPVLDWQTAHSMGQRLIAEQAEKFGFKILAEDWLMYDSSRGLFNYQVRSDQDFLDEGGITSIYFDGDTGALVGTDLPSDRNIGVSITYWLVSLHMAHVFGLPYQVLVCLMGLVIVMLSVTGIYIWLKKRHARQFSKLRNASRNQ